MVEVIGVDLYTFILAFFLFFFFLAHSELRWLEKQGQAKNSYTEYYFVQKPGDMEGALGGCDAAS